MYYVLNIFHENSLYIYIIFAANLNTQYHHKVPRPRPRPRPPRAHRTGLARAGGSAGSRRAGGRDPRGASESLLRVSSPSLSSESLLRVAWGDA